MSYFLDEEQVPGRDFGDLLGREPSPQRLGNREDPLGSRLPQLFEDLVISRGTRVEADPVNLEGPHGLQERLFERPADRHDLSGALHRRADAPVDRRELVERPARNLRDDIIEGGLEGSQCLAGDRVRDLVEAETDCNLGGDASDGIAGRLRRERGRTGDAWADFDDQILPGPRMHRALDLGPALDSERADARYRGRSHRLLIRVAYGRARRDDD